MNNNEIINCIKKSYGVSNKDIGDVIGLSPDALRMSAKRNSLSSLQLKELEKYYSLNKDESEQMNVLKPRANREGSQLKDRFDEVIKYLGVNIKSFAEGLGERPDKYYRVEKGLSQRLRSDTLEKISKSYPEINIVWLDTGRGDMLEDKVATLERNTIAVKRYKKIPFYNVNVSAGDVTFLDEGLLKGTPPHDYMEIPTDVDADIAFPTYGDSMYPEYKNGDRVAYKMLKDWSFFNYGMTCLIVTDEQRMLKIIRKHPSVGYLTLESRNKEFEPIDIPVESIRYILQARLTESRKM